MCIAILSPKGTQLTRESLFNCWENNFNGAGFMYNDNKNKLHVVKEMDSFKKFYDKYRKIRTKFSKSTMVLHFRISTHGAIDRSNCHPFKVNNNLGFVHNGVIHTVDDNDKYSDTNVFNRDILRGIPNISVELMNNSAMQVLIHEFIGKSKLVFMDNMNNYAIVNEEAGHWEKGVWYSNSSYKEVKTYVDYGGTKVSRGSLGGNRDTGLSGWGGAKWNWNVYASVKSTDTACDATDTSCMQVAKSAGYKQKTTDKVSTKGYAISDGIECCTSCGIYLLDREVTNEGGECLECLSVTEKDAVMKSATLDGVELVECHTTSLAVPSDDDKTGTEIIDCTFCGDPTYETDMVYINDWDCEVCKKCMKSMANDGYIETTDLSEFDDKALEKHES